MAGALCRSSDGELSCSVWLVGFDDLCEGGVELGASNEATLVKVDALVESIVDLPAHGITGVEVCLLRVSEQLECGGECRFADPELLVDFASFGLQAFVFDMELAEPALDLCDGQGSVGQQIEEVFFLGIEFGELLLDGVVKIGDSALFVGERLAGFTAHCLDKPLGWFECGVVLDDPVFDLPDGQVGQIAAVVASSGALEVLVGAAPPVV